MPVYEYVCTSCGERIDVRHSIATSGPTTCEFCGGVMRKALSTPAIHFKGSGWAKKDANRATRASEKKASGDGVPDSTAAATSTESTSATSGESKSTPASDSSAKAETKPAPSSSAPKATKSPTSSARKKSTD